MPDVHFGVIRHEIFGNQVVPMALRRIFFAA
jgi:hypothetical protein